MVLRTTYNVLYMNVPTLYVNDDNVLLLQVIDYLCLEDRLVEQGYRTDDVEASFVLFSNDEVKVRSDYCVLSLTQSRYD